MKVGKMFRRLNVQRVGLSRILWMIAFDQSVSRQDKISAIPIKHSIGWIQLRRQWYAEVLSTESTQNVFKDSKIIRDDYSDNIQMIIRKYELILGTQDFIGESSTLMHTKDRWVWAFSVSFRRNMPSSHSTLFYPGLYMWDGLRDHNLSYWNARK